MRKIQLLKNHSGHGFGKIIEVKEGRANYLIRVKAAKDSTEQEEAEKVTTDVTAPEAIALIKETTSLRKLNKLVKGDERKTVQDAYEKKHAELKGG